MKSCYNDVLIFDIETKIFDNRPNIEKDLMKLFGCYSYKTNKYYILERKEDVQYIISKHKFICGFNIKNYDLPIIKKESIDYQYKIIIDLYEIIDKKATQIKIKKGLLSNLLKRKTLKYIIEILDLDTENSGKKDIDYNKFRDWKEEDIPEIKEYLKRDIEITKKLYEWLENYFISFKDFLKPEDNEKKVYLIQPMAKIAYKAICKELNWKEEYNYEYNKEDAILGGFSAFPKYEEYIGNSVVLDVNSMYLMNMLMCNLYGRQKVPDNRPVYESNEFFKIEGKYYKDEMSPVGKLFLKWYRDRLEYKKNNDLKEYTLKIFLNIVYGLLDTPCYVKVYDKIAAGDCTGLGRQIIIYFRKRLNEMGYDVIYTDTDSLFIGLNNKTKDDLIQDKNIIKEEIKKHLPFPQDYFDLKVESELKAMFFVKGRQSTKENSLDIEDSINKKKGLMKKNYILITADNKMIIKNLGLTKKSTSELAKKVFFNYLKPLIIENLSIKFNKEFIINLIKRELSIDYTAIALRKEVLEKELYKLDSNLCYQISKQYGAGIHYLIPNKKIGVGKDKKYCLLSEFKDNNMIINDIDLTNVISELTYFIKKENNMLLSEFIKD